MRWKLKAKIIELYGTQKNFCTNMNISEVYLGNILQCKSNGSYKFWRKMKNLLDIPDSEIEEYKSQQKLKEGVNANNEEN